MPTRRDAVRSMGATLVPTAAAGAVAGVAIAASSLESETPDYVSRSYDESLLKKWQPRLKVSHLDVEPYAAFAKVTRSNEDELTALSYWHTYRTQNGLTGADTHFGDREPVVLFIDEEQSELRSVAYSAYHWMAGKVGDPRADSHDRVRFRAAKPWHHHILTSDSGDLVELKHFDDEEITDLLVNGWEAHVPALARPWVMQSRGHWWSNDIGSFSTDAAVVNAYLIAGLAGADQADTGNIDT